MAESTNHGELQAKIQYESIVTLLQALDVDYDHLRKLKDQLGAIHDELDALQQGKEQWLAEHPPNLLHGHPGDNGKWAMAHPDENDQMMKLEGEAQELQQELDSLLAQADDCTSPEDVQHRILESVLSLNVRSDWHPP